MACLGTQTPCSHENARPLALILRNESRSEYPAPDGFPEHKHKGSDWSQKPMGWARTKAHVSKEAFKKNVSLALMLWLVRDVQKSSAIGSTSLIVTSPQTTSTCAVNRAVGRIQFESSGKKSHHWSHLLPASAAGATLKRKRSEINELQRTDSMHSSVMQNKESCQLYALHFYLKYSLMFCPIGSLSPRRHTSSDRLQTR